MKLRAETVYTEGLLKRFAKFNLFKKSRGALKLFLLEFLLLTLSVLSAFLAFKRKSRCHFRFHADWLSLAVICLGLFIFILIMMVKLPKAIAKNSKSIIGSKLSYIFSDDKVIITVNNSRPSASIYNHIYAGYAYFEKIYETKSAFYMYIEEQKQAYILEKSGIDEGNLIQLQELLKGKVSKGKYIKRGR